MKINTINKMTISDASALVFQWFTQNDSLSLEDEFDKLVLISLTKDRDKAAVIGALQTYEELKIIKKIWSDGKVFWVLNKSLGSYEQTIIISAATTVLISQVVNKACQVLKDNSCLSDPAKITEKDIQNLVLICSTLLTSPGSQ